MDSNSPLFKGFVQFAVKSKALERKLDRANLQHDRGLSNKSFRRWKHWRTQSDKYKSMLDKLWDSCQNAADIHYLVKFYGHNRRRDFKRGVLVRKPGQYPGRKRMLRN